MSTTTVVRKKVKMKKPPASQLLLSLLTHLFLALFLLSCFSKLWAQEKKGGATLRDPQYNEKDRFRKKIPIALAPVISGLKLPVDMQFFTTHQDQALVLEKGGQVKWCLVTTGVCHPVGEIKVDAGPNEMGLLGVAIDPKFAQSSKIYLHYNPLGSPRRSRFSEWTLSHQNMRPESGKLGQERILLEVEQPYSNHKGGSLLIGPDGYLYLGLGDGGSGGDPQNHGQNLNSLLGKILRLDVDTKSNGNQYGIPQDNPFINDPKVRPEIYAYGLRNPWRFSFSLTQKLIVADVGQDREEEISLVEKGRNYGWNEMEGQTCYKNKKCDKSKYFGPIYTYTHQEGQSVTGGYIYFHGDIPELKNKYVFGDYVSGRLWAFDYPQDRKTVTEVYSLGKWPLSPSTFARNLDGELYVADYEKGIIYKFIKAQAP